MEPPRASMSCRSAASEASVLDALTSTFTSSAPFTVLAQGTAGRLLPGAAAA